MTEVQKGSAEGRNGHSTTGGGQHDDSDSGSHEASNVSQMLNMDEQKGRAASALRDVATTLRERATNAPLPGVDMAAQAAARPLESSAAYLEDHTPGDMWTDLMSFCREHPAGALFIGFGSGYIFHKLFR